MEFNERLIKTVILTGFGLIGLTTVIRRLLGTRLRPFKKVGVVVKLFIYPIKSLRPIEMDQLDYMESYLYWKQLKDRAFMLVNRKNVMLTQRQEPRLSLLNVTLNYPFIEVTTPDGRDSILISVLDSDYDDRGEIKASREVDIIKTNIWGDDVCGIDCGANYSQFFSTYLGKPDIKLLRFSQQLDHRPSQFYQNGEIGKDLNIPIIYQDTATVHLINVKSVDQLNQWIEKEEEKVTFANFRPNIVVDADPFDEDEWEKMRIGSTQWQQLLKCIRCRIPTINIDKGTFNKEPLVALKRHRLLAKEDLGYIEEPKDTSIGRPTLPLMGVFFNPESPGTIKIGQYIWASHKRKSYWYF